MHQNVVPESMHGVASLGWKEGCVKHSPIFIAQLYYININVLFLYANMMIMILMSTLQ